MRQITLIFILFSVGLNLFSAITLQQAIEKGIKINLQCQNQELQEKIQLIHQQTTRLNRFFTINAGGSYLYRSQEMEIIMPDRQVAPGLVVPGNRIKAGSKHNFDFKISLYQPLYTGNILSNLNRVEALNTRQQKNQILLVKVETSSAIKTSFYNYRSHVNKECSLLALLKQLQLHSQKLKNLFDEELITESSLLETEAKIQEWKLKLVDLNLLKRNEKIFFHKLCGLDIDTIQPANQEHVAGFEQSFSSFKSNHPLILSLDQKISILKLQKKIKRGEALPQINGFSELHYGKPGIDFFKNEWSLYLQAGISVDFKLFQWHKNKRDVAIIDHQLAKVVNQKEDLIKNGKTALAQLFETLTTLNSKLKLTDRLLAITLRDIQLKKKLLIEQQISNFDYLATLTRNEQIMSQSNDLKAQRELIKVYINKTIGQLVEDQ